MKSHGHASRHRSGVTLHAALTLLGLAACGSDPAAMSGATNTPPGIGPAAGSGTYVAGSPAAAGNATGSAGRAVGSAGTTGVTTPPSAGAPVGTTAGAPPASTAGGAAPGGAGAAGTAPPTGAAGSGPTTPDPTDLSVFKDPGKSDWTVVPEAEAAEKCKLDVSKLSGLSLGSGFAVIRYGQMCYRKPATDGPTAMWSATKTLGATVTGIANYETRDIMRSGERTGQLSDMDKATYWMGTVSYNREAYLAHVLSMEAHNSSLAYGSKKHAYDTVGSVQINTLSTMIDRAIAQDEARLGNSTASLAQKFLFDEIGMKDSSWGGTVFAYSWSATLGDMARLGTLLIHQGVWSGKRVIGADWVYKQTHPAFEDGNTAYGYLTWLVAKEGQTSIGGGSFTSGGNSAGGLLSDDCSPSAVWQHYPHSQVSEAPDCTYKMTPCAQKYDVGSWSAQGLGGQFVIGHPGLDLVIVAKDFSGGDGPAGIWKSVRAALIPYDPMYKDDDAAFCKAYSAGEYAPDLPAPVVQPADQPKM